MLKKLLTATEMQSRGRESKRQVVLKMYWHIHKGRCGSQMLSCQIFFFFLKLKVEQSLIKVVFYTGI